MWTLQPRTKRDQRPETFTGPTIKAALLVAFGLMFGVWLLAGYYFTKRIADIERRSVRINARYMQSQDLLSTVRAQVLLGSVYVRDALLDPDPSTADDYRRQMESTYRAADAALAQYLPVVDTPADRARVDGLHRELDDFRSTMLQVLGTDSRQWTTQARVLLRTRIVPRRETVIRVSEQVQSLNRVAFVQQQAGIARGYTVAQRRLWEGLGLALVTSLGIGLLATIYAIRLEGRISERRILDEQNAAELHRLSAKLIRAQEEERRSIARELHDEVGQVLTAIRVELAVAQRALDEGAGPPHLLDDARSVTEGAVATVRDLSHLLHPALLDDLGLPAAIEWYLREFGRRHGMRTEAVCDRLDNRLASETETSAYRIVQEAVTNVANHARATTCRVYLRRLRETVSITIEDDGTGFTPEMGTHPGRQRGLGLIGIRERAAELGGTFWIDTAPGAGTRLTVELPARGRAHPDSDREPNVSHSPAHPVISPA